jgi:3-oxoacyl-[acyl-carrier protein] reductase
MANRIANKIATVTGGARGIGRSTALLFAQEGATVVILDRDGGGAERTCHEIEQAGGAALALETNVADAQSVTNAFALITEKFGKLDALVNNAGIAKGKLFEHMTPDEWESVWQTNLQGTITCTQAAIPLLKKGLKPRVINIASILARAHSKKLSAYSASKGAVANISRTLACELGSLDIRVNYIMPGFIRTDMTESLVSKRLYRKVIEWRTPLKRLGKPADVAKVALFLASSDSDFITGEGITVDGGLMLHAI